MITVIGVRHTGQPAASSATPLAQDSKKRACPHGIKTNPCGGSTGTPHSRQECDWTVFSGYKQSMFHSSDLHPRPPMSSPAISAPPPSRAIILVASLLLLLLLLSSSSSSWSLKCSKRESSYTGSDSVQNKCVSRTEARNFQEPLNVLLNQVRRSNPRNCWAQ